MAERAAPFARVHVDFGTGDGRYVLRAAREAPDVLFVGVDATDAGLYEASRRASLKPARGGLTNAIFGRLALEDAPGELEGFAHGLSVILPWGSLLGALATAEPSALARLRALCRTGAELRIVLGYGSSEGPAARAHALPPLESDGALGELARRYAEVGLRVRARRLARSELGSLDTTWARKLSFSSTPRSFIELRGTARA